MSAAVKRQKFPKIAWRSGPRSVRVAEGWVLDLPQGMAVAQGWQMKRFLEATGNRIEGSEVAVAGPGDLRWFVIISAHRGAGAGAKRTEWMERTQEADGRRVEIRTQALPAGNALLTFEVVSEEAQASEAGVEFDALSKRLRAEGSGPDWWAAAPAAAAAALGALLFVRLRRRRDQRSL